MSDFATVPDAWMEDILIHLNFFQQCQRRRTCRRWNRLLTGSHILGTMIYPRCIEGQENRNPNLWDEYMELPGRTGAENAFKHAATFLHTLILTEGRHKSCKNAGYCKWWGDAVVQGVDLLQCLDQNLVDFPRRLVLANMRNVYVSQPSMYPASWGMVFQRVILKNVAFDRETLPHVVQDMIEVEYYYMDADHGYDHKYCPCTLPLFNAPELQVTIAGEFEYILEFGEPVGMDPPFDRNHKMHFASLWKLYEDHMKPLTAAQIEELKRRLVASQKQPLLVEWINEILKRFHPNVLLDAAQDLSRLELTSLSAPVQRLLFSFQSVQYKKFTCWMHPPKERDLVALEFE